MAQGDLTTLADVKAWLGRSDANSDTALSALITRASRQIASYLARPLILPHAASERGRGASRILLGDWPVLSIASVTVDGEAIAQAGARTPGWSLEPWNGAPPGRPQILSLRSFGDALTGGRRLDIAYRAGYAVLDEPQTIAGGALTAAAPYGAWGTDEGVAYADGVPLSAVASAPAQGQYAPGATAGTYLFNAADNGAAVLLSYGYVPADLADACIELVAERYKYAQRIGEKSHSLGGNETVSFDNTRLTPLVVSLLQPYRRVVVP